MFLNIPGSAKFVEGALGHPREDVDHGIDAILLIAIREGHHFNAVGEEGTVEKTVQQKHLTCKIIKKTLI